MSENENEHGDLRIDIERFGPGPEVTDAVREAVSGYSSVQEYLGEARNRVLSVELLNPTGRGKPNGPVPPDGYRATIYDYTNNRVVLATGLLDDIHGSMVASEAGHLPLPPSSPRTTGTPTGSRPHAAEDQSSAEGGRSGTRRPATPTT